MATENEFDKPFASGRTIEKTWSERALDDPEDDEIDPDDEEEDEDGMLDDPDDDDQLDDAESEEDTYGQRQRSPSSRDLD